jgi:hypothetical protein
MNTWPLGTARRRALERELHRVGDAALFSRVLALLEVDQGCSVSEVAQHLQVTRLERLSLAGAVCCAGGIESLFQQPGQGRPLSWSEELEEPLQSALTQPPAEIICANHQHASIDTQAISFIDYLQSLPAIERLRKAGVLAKCFWLQL